MLNQFNKYIKCLLCAGHYLNTGETLENKTTSRLSWLVFQWGHRKTNQVKNYLEYDKLVSPRGKNKAQKRDKDGECKIYIIFSFIYIISVFSSLFFIY